MDGFFLYILFSICMFIVMVLVFSIKEKGRMGSMQRMVLAMGSAMSIGLTIGVLAGAVFKGNLFESTIISMLLGVTAGILCGAFFGLLATVEGAMSGLMGGMMGAMLGEMLAVSEAATMLMVLLMLCCCSIMLGFVLRSEKEKVKVAWIWKPIVALLLFGGYLVYGLHLSDDIGKRPASEENHHH
ncbi:hypothetical protein ACQCT5_19680 [Sutcliffiella halmapala]